MMNLTILGNLQALRLSKVQIDDMIASDVTNLLTTEFVNKDTKNHINR